MGVFSGPDISESGLILALDAANPRNFNLTAVEVLVVAGGGGGGGRSGGGGGAGGLIYNSNFSVTPGSALTVTVGNGGSGGAGTGNAGSDGGNSVFGSITATGGGGGSGDSPTTGRNGGSGGGGKYGSAGGTGTSGQGFAGGSGTSGTWKAGGGGGAGGVGVNGVGSPHKCGNGGPGLGFDISGTFTYYAGGGGGGSHNSDAGGCCDDATARGLGGIGGGGNGGTPGGFNAGDNATSNTGGGGGGGSTISSNGGAGGNGGSGIVIVRYEGPQKAIGGTVTSVNGYTIHTFTTVESTTFTPLVATNNSAILGLSDLSGRGNFGTSVNGPTYSSANGGSIEFDGSNDYVDLGSQKTLKSSGGWTVSSWINLSQVNSGSLYNFIGSTNIVHNSWYWTVYQSKLALWNISPGGWYYGSTTIQPNVWYNCVLVCSDSGTSYQMYLNGVAEGGTHTTYTWNASYAGLIVRYIGRGDISNGRYFYGKYPQISIYNRALAAQEIQQNFNAARSRFGI